MTPEEHAAHITQGWRAIELAVEYNPGVPISLARPDSVYVNNAVPWAREIIAASIRAAVEQAVAEEREACARIAEIAIYNGGNYPGLHREGMSDAGERIAAAIRARKGMAMSDDEAVDPAVVLMREVRILREQVERLRAALLPLAAAVTVAALQDTVDGEPVTDETLLSDYQRVWGKGRPDIGDCRRAAEALKGTRQR